MGAGGGVNSVCLSSFDDVEEEGMDVGHIVTWSTIGRKANSKRPGKYLCNLLSNESLDLFNTQWACLLSRLLVARVLLIFP